MSEPVVKYRATVTRRPPSAAVAVQPDLKARLTDLQRQQLETVRQAGESDPAEPEPTTRPEPPPAQARPKRGPHDLQLDFLNANLGRPVTVFLMNGIKLVGKIRRFDQFTLLLRGDACDNLIFKHAVSTIQPAFHQG